MNLKNVVITMNKPTAKKKNKSNLQNDQTDNVLCFSHQINLKLVNLNSFPSCLYPINQIISLNTKFIETPTEL